MFEEGKGRNWGDSKSNMNSYLFRQRLSTLVYLFSYLYDGEK